MNKQEELLNALKLIYSETPFNAELLRGQIPIVISALEHQLTNGWIPVSESLPEENIDGITDDFLPYNVSLKFKYGECVRTYQFGQGRWWKNGDDMTAYVIAWQPLPPKYEEVSDG